MQALSIRESLRNPRVPVQADRHRARRDKRSELTLIPFHEEGGYRFFFASPETCAAHIERSSFSARDYVFVINDWYVPDHPNGVHAYRRIAKPGFGNLRIMCNSRVEQQILVEDFRFPRESTLFCPRHFRHDSKGFAAAPGRTRDELRYDAVLNARSKPYKNRWAASNIASLAVIDFEVRRPEFSCQYYNQHHLDLEEVASVLRRSRVGLCLSFIEGASLASLEYLLCGLPVVSTRSLGGRNNWYHDGNCILVGPEVADGMAGRFDRAELREEVAEAVSTWIGRIQDGCVDPVRIRESALAVNRRFAERFLNEIAGISGSSEKATAAGRRRLVLEPRPYTDYGVYAS